MGISLLSQLTRDREEETAASCAGGDLDRLDVRKISSPKRLSNI